MKCSGARFEFEDSELSDAVRTDVVLFIDHDLYEKGIKNSKPKYRHRDRYKNIFVVHAARGQKWTILYKNVDEKQIVK